MRAQHALPRTGTLTGLNAFAGFFGEPRRRWQRHCSQSLVVVAARTILTVVELYYLGTANTNAKNTRTVTPKQTPYAPPHQYEHHTHRHVLTLSKSRCVCRLLRRAAKEVATSLLAVDCRCRCAEHPHRRRVVHDTRTEQTAAKLGRYVVVADFVLR